MAAPIINSRSSSSVQNPAFAELARSSAPKGVAASLSKIESAADSRNNVYAGKGFKEGITSFFNWFLSIFKDCYAKVFGSKTEENAPPAPAALQALQALLATQEPAKEAVVAAFNALTNEQKTAVKNHMRDAILDRLAEFTRTRAIENVEDVEPEATVTADRAAEIARASFNAVIGEDIPGIHASVATDEVRNPLAVGSLFRQVVPEMREGPHQQGLVDLLAREDATLENVRVFLEDGVDGRDAFAREVVGRMVEKLVGLDEDAKGLAARQEHERLQGEAGDAALRQLGDTYSLELIGNIIAGTELPEAEHREGEEEDVCSARYLNEHLLDQGSLFRDAVAALAALVQEQE